MALVLCLGTFSWVGLPVTVAPTVHHIHRVHISLNTLDNATEPSQQLVPQKLDDLVASAREYIDRARDNAASYLRVTPPWIDAAFGCLLFVSLNAACKEITFLAFPSPEADAASGRLLAVAAFAGLQQLAGLPTSEWLKLGVDPKRVDPNPLFQSGSPLAGITFAFMFAVPLATAAQLLGIAWLPEPRPFPDGGGCNTKMLSNTLYYRVPSVALCVAVDGSLRP